MRILTITVDNIWRKIILYHGMVKLGRPVMLKFMLKTAGFYSDFHAMTRARFTINT